MRDTRTSGSQDRRRKRALRRFGERDMRKRVRNVAKLDRWIKENPRNPLAIRLRAKKVGIDVVDAEDMTAKPERESGGETRRGSGLVLPSEVDLERPREKRPDSGSGHRIG